MEFKSRVKHKVLNSQSREVVHNVYKFMKEEADKGIVLIPLPKIQERVARSVGVSLSTVKSVVKQGRCIEKGETSSFETHHNKRKEGSQKSLDNFEKSLLRRTVHEWYIQEKSAPTLRRIHKKFEEIMEYTGSRESLRKVLHEIGFRWRKTKTNRRLLMERHDFRDSRLNFLRRIKAYREEGRPIVYMDETCVNSSLTHDNAWSEDDNNKGIRKHVAKGQRVRIVDAGWENGFIPNARLIFRSKAKPGDNDEMTYVDFKKWVETKLVTNLPPRSVLVVGTAPYHNVQSEKFPSTASLKEDMKQWLRDRGIQFDDDMLKTDLYNIVKMHKPQYKTYEMDRILQNSGHSVLRLPPYQPDLNPIEDVWVSLKEYVASKNVTFTIANVEKLCYEFFHCFSPEEWRTRCQHVINVEREMLAQEPVLDSAIDYIINLQDCDSDSELDIVSDECVVDSDSDE